MLVGMGTVFVFLTVLVIGMSTMSSVVLRFMRGADDASAANDEEVAAITAAISQHRAKAKK